VALAAPWCALPYLELESGLQSLSVTEKGKEVVVEERVLFIIPTFNSNQRHFSPGLTTTSGNAEGHGACGNQGNRIETRPN
jgi:hypothetical protein